MKNWTGGRKIGFLLSLNRLNRGDTFDLSFLLAVLNLYSKAHHKNLVDFFATVGVFVFGIMSNFILVDTLYAVCILASRESQINNSVALRRTKKHLGYQLQQRTLCKSSIMRRLRFSLISWRKTYDLQVIHAKCMEKLHIIFKFYINL